MNKHELVKKMQEHLNTSIANIAFSQKDAETILDSVGAVVTDALIKGEEVKLPSIGTFSVVDKKARSARNPRTGEVVAVPAKKAPRFSASKTLKNAII